MVGVVLAQVARVLAVASPARSHNEQHDNDDGQKDADVQKASQKQKAIFQRLHDDSPLVLPFPEDEPSTPPRIVEIYHMDGV